MLYFLAVDLGTTGCRSIIFDSSLSVVSSAYEEYGLITPHEGYVEQDAELWWQLTLKTAKNAIKKSGINPKELKSISLSSQGITIVPVDNNCIPLCNALSWLDMRALKETKRIENDFGNNYIFSQTGKPINVAYTLPKLLWIKENMPEVWKNAYKFLMPLDFLTAKLTGKFVTDHSMASGTLFYDIKHCCWHKKILDYYDIPKEKLPVIEYSGTCVGKVSKEVAKELELDPECTVAVGAQDQKCAAHGVGLTGDKVSISLGTAGAITKLWDSPLTERYTSVGWCGYTSPGSWVTEGVVNSAGTCLRWIRDLMFPNEGYDIIDQEAESAINNGNSLVFLPFLGESASFYGANFSTTRGAFAASVMEGVAFEIRYMLELMGIDDTIKSLILFGGGAKGALWCNIIANVLNRNILVPSTEEAAGAGAAMLAAMACDVTLNALSVAKVYEPTKNYDKKYKEYVALRSNMRRN